MLTSQDELWESRRGRYDRFHCLFNRLKWYNQREQAVIHYNSEKMQRAKHEFLDDLSNYIPLGSMTLPILDTDEPVSVSGWQENGCGEEATYGVQELRSVRFARTFTRKHLVQRGMLTMRVYVLPCDVGRRFFFDNEEFMRRGFMLDLMETLDASFKSWEGLNEVDCFVTHYSQAILSNHDSLIYLFNTVRSPSPNPEHLSCHIGKVAATSILQGTVRGLKSQLYPFQRRSAATMIMREVEPSRSLDPRVELYVGPTGLRFYYDQASGVLLRDRRDYEEVCGGILAEVCALLKTTLLSLMRTDETLQSMGYGKTLICLAAILATKGHWPRIPPQYSLGLNPVRPRVGTLREMAAATIGRAQIPWRTYFENMGEDTIKQNYLKILENNIGSYVIPPPVNGRDQRSAFSSKPRRIVLCSTTLIIVPPNLIYQWTHEISLHLDEKALKVLVVDNLKTPLPLATDILSYDVILMVKNRLEKELKHVQEGDDFQKDNMLCQCRFENECICNEKRRYCSPMTNLHFLRIIVDEGHGFVGSKLNGATLALDKLNIERKWIVSGTPTAGLLGVELDTAAREVLKQEDVGEWTSHEASLKALRHQTALLQEASDVKQLGRIVVNFFRLKPWANSRSEDPASWQKYVMPSTAGRKPRCLRSILESLVVRHGIDDIEQDVQLPPLYNRRVYLQPSWHDKLSINLFIISLVANAVTSERMDEDYMFHPANRTQLDKLITKLRQSGFYWVGFPPRDVYHTMDVCRSYQDEVINGDRHCAPRDLFLLNQVMDIGEKALSSLSWKAFAELHEMGIYVEDFPPEHCDRWSLVPGHRETPLLVGATQLIEAQNLVDLNLYSPNPELALSPAKTSSKRRTLRGGIDVIENQQLANENEPSSAVTSHRLRINSKPKAKRTPRLRKENTISYARVAASPADSRASPRSVLLEGTNSSGQTRQNGSVSQPMVSHIREHSFLPDSPLANTKVVGTASAKLSYLIDRVTELERDEKILIFFHGDHIAYFIAQAFDLLGIRYLIYTATLGLSRQSVYATTFNTTETFRVMLMDINQAAHGLNMASASRVFFVNPVWQPNVEAQAIKRAHRIGQKRPVFVESLVLEGTLEAQMLERRKQMSTEDHQKAKKGPMDDPVMGDIIRNAEVIPLAQFDRDVNGREMASLAVPQPLFGRMRSQSTVLGDPDADLIFPAGMARQKLHWKHAKRLREPEDAASLLTT